MEHSPPPSTDPRATPLLHPEEFKELAAHVQHHANRWSNTSGMMVIWGLITIIVSASVSLLIGLPIAIIGFGIVFSGLAFTLQWTKFTALKCDKETERLLQFLADTQDADMLGPILDLHDTRNGPGKIYDLIRPSIDAAVLRLLPLIQNSHGVSLTSRHRDHILHYRHAGVRGMGMEGLDKLAYTHVVVHAMEQVGNEGHLPQIKYWARSAACSHELAVALQRCILTIERRVARENGKEYLLRSSDNPVPVETLLRPATECTNTPSDQLLRAADEQVPPPREISSSSDIQS